MYETVSVEKEARRPLLSAGHCRVPARRPQPPAPPITAEVLAPGTREETRYFNTG